MDDSDQNRTESAEVGASVLAPTSSHAGEERKLRWPRVLLKLSGEAFAADPDAVGQTGSDPRVGLNYITIRSIATEVVAAHSGGAEIAIVIGGGNIIRGERA